MSLLQTRVVNRNDKSILKDALYISGTNVVVDQINTHRLDELEGPTIELNALVFSDTRGKFEPPLDNKGDIKGTTLQYRLRFKKGCRVMLKYNIDVTDGLTNGSQGTLIDIERNTDWKIQYLLVLFDKGASGAKRRQSIQHTSFLPNVTPMECIEKIFSLSKKSMNAFSTATAIQYPVRLAYAATAHKIQGHTLKKPQPLVVDLVTWLQPAMAYVMLSRVQSLVQLYILIQYQQKNPPLAIGIRRGAKNERNRS